MHDIYIYAQPAYSHSQWMWLEVRYYFSVAVDWWQPLVMCTYVFNLTKGGK